MITKIVAFLSFFVPFILLSSFFADPIQKSFFGGTSGPLTSLELDIVTFTFSAALGLAVYGILNQLKPLLASVLSFLQKVNGKNTQ